MRKKQTKLTKDQVRHVARLAGFTLSEKEVAKFQKQLSDTLEYVSVLDELDTSKIEATGQVTGLENVFREDRPTSSLSQKEVLSNAPSEHNGFFKVKGIFDET